MKSAKEKKRKHSRRESAAGERKRKSTESSVADPKEEQYKVVQEVKEEPSDIEEGGLDLTVPFKPINAYVSNRQEMLEECFYILGQNKLKKMLPDELKDCTFTEIKTLCWDQLQLLSDNTLLQILEGKEVTANSEDETKETNGTSADSQQDNGVDSTSSMKETAEAEDKQGSGLSGEESDVLSINADSDIEGHKDPKPQEEEVQASMVMPPVSPAPPPETDLQPDEPKLELQRDIDRSVSEILALTERSSDEAQVKQASVETVPASILVPAGAPSAQQLALLELEMRARAIKALMKAYEVKK